MKKRNKTKKNVGKFKKNLILEEFDVESIPVDIN